MRKPRMTKLGQGVGVRAHYPICTIYIVMYIDGPCATKTLAGVFLRDLKEWVTLLTFINRTKRKSAYAVGLGFGIPHLKCF